MAINKNQLAGKRGGEARNEEMNGGIHGCLRKYNASNVGANWKVKNRKGRKPVSFAIKSKKRSSFA